MKYFQLTGYFLTVLLLCLASGLAAQDEGPAPYHLSLKREAPYVLGSALLLLKGEELREDLEPISISDILNQDLFDPEVDEIKYHYSHRSAHKISNVTMYTSVGLTALLLADRDARNDFGKITLLFTETMLVNQGITNFTKAVFHRPRPYVLNPEWAPERLVYSGDQSSMISGHTSGAAAGAFFFARVFADYHPDSKLKPYVWGVAATLPAVTGWMRVRAAKHYPSDVMAGYAVGAAVGYLVPVLHRKPLMKGRLTISPSGGGVYAAYVLR